MYYETPDIEKIAGFLKQIRFITGKQNSSTFKKVKTELMPQLEQQRLLLLREDYDPGNNWWGSKVND